MSITPPAASAPTEPLPPAASSAPAGARPFSDTASPAGPQGTPWYRRAWAIAVAAVLLAVLAFGSGFVAGNAASLFDGLIGGPGAGFDGPRFPDGERRGDGELPQFPGDGTSQGDGS